MLKATKLIGQGTDAEVWLLEDGKKVAKIFYHHHNLVNEFDVMRQLRKIPGVRTPELFGVEKVAVARIKKRWFGLDKLVENTEKALIMEYVDGKDISKFKHNSRITHQFKEQIGRCINHGWYPGDANVMNGIVANGKVYLIDFSGWMKYNEEDLKEMQDVGWFNNFNLREIRQH